MDFQNDDISMNTVVGNGSSVQGNLFVAGLMRVDGDIAGRLESTGKVIVGSKARIKADIIAVSVIVCGVVEGDIVAPEGVHVFPNAVVFGDIVTKRLQIDDDVIVQGRCIALRDEERFLEVKKRWLDIKAVNGKTF